MIALAVSAALFATIQAITIWMLLGFFARMERRIESALADQTLVESRLAIDLAEAMQNHQRMISSAKNAQEESFAAEIYFRTVEGAHSDVLRWCHRNSNPPRGVHVDSWDVDAGGPS